MNAKYGIDRGDSGFYQTLFPNGFLRHECRAPGRTDVGGPMWAAEFGRAAVGFFSLLLLVGCFDANAAPPGVTLNIGRSNGVFVSWSAAPGSTYSIQSKTNLSDPWVDANDVPNGLDATNNSLGRGFSAAASPMRFFRVLLNPAGMARIPAGEFLMGDSSGDGIFGAPVRTIYVSPFYVDRTPVPHALWQQVLGWATNNGYSFKSFGAAQATNHPVVKVAWYDCVKWCNARSEFEGMTPAYYTDAAHRTVYRAGEIDLTVDMVDWSAGYRLPTEAEWEKAARGGLAGKRFPWGNTISHGQANYFALPSLSYDITGYLGWHPIWSVQSRVSLTNPIDAFPSNGYGLRDMAGNVSNWCWDFPKFATGYEKDPKGNLDNIGSRAIRGGNWFDAAEVGRCAFRSSEAPGVAIKTTLGLRTVLPAK